MRWLIVTTSLYPDEPLAISFKWASERENWEAHLTELMEAISADLGDGKFGITAYCRYLNHGKPKGRRIQEEHFSFVVRCQFLRYTTRKKKEAENDR